MSERIHIKYKFSKEGAIKAGEVLRALVNKRYLDRNGIVKTVKSVIVTPYDMKSLQQFLREPNLLADSGEILARYKCNDCAVLFLLESPDLRITNYTIEEFEAEFGILPKIMEMVLDHETGSIEAQA